MVNKNKFLYLINLIYYNKINILNFISKKMISEKSELLNGSSLMLSKPIKKDTNKSVNIYTNPPKKKNNNKTKKLMIKKLMTKKLMTKKPMPKPLMLKLLILKKLMPKLPMLKPLIPKLPPKLKPLLEKNEFL